MKIKFSKNLILSLLTAALAVVCALSVYAPIRFDRLRAGRERVVKERLVRIRYAQEKYRKQAGTYADSFDTLVRAGLLADSLQYIPFSGGRKFELTVTTQIGKSGRAVPLMECGATYDEYLKGLDANSIANLSDEANVAGRYPGLKIGDITMPNDNAGNWE